MNKELILELREAAKQHPLDAPLELFNEAADALEAKAAPVGDRDAYEAWKLSMKPYGFDGFDAYQAGAAQQRAQQPQSAEAVAWIPATTYPPFGEIVLTNIGPAYMTEKIPGVWFKRLENLGMGTRIVAGAVKQWREIATPQPSAGVVMPELAECWKLADQLANGSHLDEAPNHDDDSLRELACLMLYSKRLIAQAERAEKLAAMLARLNGKEVGK